MRNLVPAFLGSPISRGIARALLVLCMMLGWTFNASARLVYFHEGSEFNPRALYSLDPSTGISRLITTVGGTELFMSMTVRPSDGTVFAMAYMPFSNGINDSHLYTINVDTGVATFFAATGLDAVTNITFNPLTGKLFGLGVNSNNLYSIVETNGSSTFIGNTGPFGVGARAALSFAPNGDLFAFSNSNSLYKIDPSNASQTLIATGVFSGLPEASTFTPDGRMFVTSWNVGILEVNVASGQLVSSFTTGFGSGHRAIVDIPDYRIPINSLTFQGVTFTTRLVGNVFDVEIDAAARTGDWATAMYIDAIELSGIGTFASFTMGGSGASWTPNKANLSASGCKSGRRATDACAQGVPLSLGDNMHFTFTFDANATLDDTAPLLTVRFLNAKLKKQGSMLAQPIPQVP